MSVVPDVYIRAASKAPAKKEFPKLVETPLVCLTHIATPPSCVGELHLLPAFVKKSGQANVKECFIRVPDPEVDGGEHVQFRGRLLRGVPVSVPEGMRGFVMSEASSAHAATKQWTVSSQFDKFHYWLRDKAPSSSDQQQQWMQWQALANSIHAPMDANEVKRRIEELKKDTNVAECAKKRTANGDADGAPAAKKKRMAASPKKKTPKKSGVSPVKEAKSPKSKSSPKKSPVKKSPIKKSPAKRVTPAKKSPAKRSTPEKKATPTKKAKSAKMSPAKRTPSRKSPAAKTPDRKASAKKTTPKTSPKKSTTPKKISATHKTTPKAKSAASSPRKSPGVKSAAKCAAASEKDGPVRKKQRIESDSE